MKRCWFGLILLLVLLIICAGASRYMTRVHAPLVQSAADAADYALRGDWGNALTLTRNIRSQFENRWGIIAAVADHEPMEQVSSLFRQLDAYAAAGDTVGYASVCAALSASLDAMADASSLTWWNFLQILPVRP